MNNFCTEQQHHALPKVTIILSLAMLLLFTLAGCGGGSSALVGKWKIEDGQPRRNHDIKLEDMELLKDGTGIIDQLKIIWKAEKGRFFVTVTIFGTEVSEAFDYKISRSKLTLTDNDGESITYKKAVSGAKKPTNKPKEEPSSDDIDTVINNPMG